MACMDQTELYHTYLNERCAEVCPDFDQWSTSELHRFCSGLRYFERKLQRLKQELWKHKIVFLTVPMPWDNPLIEAWEFIDRDIEKHPQVYDEKEEASSMEVMLLAQGTLNNFEHPEILHTLADESCPVVAQLLSNRAVCPFQCFWNGAPNQRIVVHWD